MNKDIENTLIAIGAIAGSIAVELGVACARAWLLSLAVALFAPCHCSQFLAMGVSGGDHSFRAH